jgi:acyl carrier protein
MSDLRDQVKLTMFSAVAATMDSSVEELRESTEFIADLDAKSVNFVRIIGALEDEFELEIPFMEFRRKKTIGEAIEYILQLCDS